MKNKIIGINRIEKFSKLGGDNIVALIQRTSLIKENLPLVKIDKDEKYTENIYSFSELTDDFEEKEILKPKINNSICSNFHLISYFCSFQSINTNYPTSDSPPEHPTKSQISQICKPQSSQICNC